jgi:hypothetical protein
MNDDNDPFEYIKKSLAVRRISILDSVVTKTKPTTDPHDNSMRLMNRWMELAQRAFILGVIHGHRQKLAAKKAKQKQEKKEAEMAEMCEQLGNHHNNCEDCSIDSDDESIAMIQDEDLIVF